MHELNRTISKIDVLLPPVEYIKNILQAICDHLGYSFATVIEADGAGAGKMLVSCNLPQDYPERVNKVDAPLLSSPSGEAIETGSIVVVTDLFADPRLLPWIEIMQEYSIMTVLWVPLFREGKAFGTCVLYDTKKRDVPEGELAVLEQIGVMVSISIMANQYLSELSIEIEERKVVEKELRQMRDELGVQVESRTIELSKVNSELQLFKDLMDNSMDAIHIVEPGSGRFLDVNETACSDLGYTREELLNKNVTDIDATLDDADLMQLIAKIKHKGYATLQSSNLRKDGSIFPVEVNIRHASFGHTEYIVAIVRDITERKKAEAAFSESEDRYRGLLNSASDGIFIHDLNGKFIDANDVACGLFRHTYDELMQMTVMDSHPSQLASKIKQRILDIIQHDSVINELTIMLDGKVMILEMKSQLIEYGNKSVILNITRDITERKRLEYSLKYSQTMLEKRVAERTGELEMTNIELSDANAKLREVDVMKSEFLDTVSHELRTPLTSIIGYSSLLLAGIQGDLNKKQTQYVDGIWRKGMHQLQLVNDILDLSKLEAHSMRINLESVSVSKSIKDAIEDVMPLIKDKQHETVIEIAEGVDNVYADGIRLKQVLLNFVSNAIKFTPDNGKIIVKANSEGDMVRISVIDNGIGMRQEDVGKLFNRFIQVDQSNTRRVGGAGLGLAIVKELMELMGGSIDLESEFGKGSTFSVLLPVAQSQNTINE